MTLQSNLDEYIVLIEGQIFSSFSPLRRVTTSQLKNMGSKKVLKIFCSVFQGLIVLMRP